MKNRKAAIFLLVSQIVYALFSLAWIIVALMSFMMFDTPEALSDAQTLFIFFMVWAYPVALIGSAVVSWVFYHKRKFKGAVRIDLIPLLWVLGIGLLYTV